MNKVPADLYLDLLKKALTFTLWPEPPVPIETFNYRTNPMLRWSVSTVAGLLQRKHLHIGRQRVVTAEERQEGRIWPGYAHTMIGLKRLDNIQSCVETVLREGVEGDLIETGVWRGGSGILMRGVLAAHGVEDRTVYLADSFEGLPKADPQKYPADSGDEHHTEVYLAVSQEEVEDNFRKYGLLDDRVAFLKGWFKDTLPEAPIRKLSILRLDGDMYGSTMDVLGNLYSKLSPGGFCIIDDYALPGCKAAVDDFRRDERIDAELKTVDWTGRFWRKP